eukprot:scaffold664810_cov80-Prasinocladus_malaysianus.AAC.1
MTLTLLQTTMSQPVKMFKQSTEKYSSYNWTPSLQHDPEELLSTLVAMRHAHIATTGEMVSKSSTIRSVFLEFEHMHDKWDSDTIS